MRRLRKPSDVSVQQLLTVLQLQQAAHGGKIEPTDWTQAQSEAPCQGLERMGHRARLEHAEAPRQIAIDRLDGSRLADEKQRKARLLADRPVDEWLVDGRTQFRAQGNGHESMLNGVIVEGPRWKAFASVGLGMQIGLHGVQAACRAIAIFGPALLHR